MGDKMNKLLTLPQYTLCNIALDNTSTDLVFMMPAIVVVDANQQLCDHAMNLYHTTSILKTNLQTYFKTQLLLAEKGLQHFSISKSGTKTAPALIVSIRLMNNFLEGTKTKKEKPNCRDFKHNNKTVDNKTDPSHHDPLNTFSHHKLLWDNNEEKKICFNRVIVCYYFILCCV